MCSEVSSAPTFRTSTSFQKCWKLVAEKNTDSLGVDAEREWLGFNKGQIHPDVYMNEQGHKTSTGKVFRSGHVHSILKIYRIRKLRVEKEATSKLSKFDLYFVDKTLVNQT